MFDWKLLSSPRFWFVLEWNPLQRGTALIMSGVFGAFLLVGILLWTLPKRRREIDPPLRRALCRGGNVFFTTGLLGLFFTFTAYQQAGVFAMRFWFLLILLLFLFWGGWSLWRAHITVPAEREAASIRSRIRRYLTRKRKK